ncbi:pyruvate kinase [Bacillus songklensis]|uniref:Pyruvate kinase n=1 Tax=Bacillus songklensis TaxID=1069116 RepID=A0ABV8B1T2_9BACI
MTIDKICTIGPASQEREVLKELIDHGMTIVRLNLSHGTHDQHKKVIQTVYELNSNIKILGDIQGPKIRLGEIGAKEIQLKENETFTLHTTPIVGNETEASVDYEGITKDIKEGARLLINDGQVELFVEKAEEDKLVTKVVRGGAISSHKGVNLPGTSVSLPAMTEKDKEDLLFLQKEKVDYIACSFIRKSAHLQEIRSFLGVKKGEGPSLIAKIETMEGVRHFSAIREEADGVMIARGDLGVELPFEWVPLLQKAMMYECREHGTYVITATQMLQSMVNHSVATRAEVTDVFQAVLDGTNAVMLSQESATGEYPVESVNTLKVVSSFAEYVANDAPFTLSDMMDLLKSGLH